jgi:catechol 2,3-dioxygenase-like lactoylglutathione lyase family enzyme
MKKVTGIGGVFFKCKDPQAAREWYSKHLGLDAGEYGASFEWKHADDSREGLTQWSPFKDTTTYFGPGKQDHMINYIVDDLEQLVKELASNGVTIVDTLQDSDYGKFVHILDLEGNQVELWEPK